MSKLILITERKPVLQDFLIDVKSRAEFKLRIIPMSIPMVASTEDNSSFIRKTFSLHQRIIA